MISTLGGCSSGDAITGPDSEQIRGATSQLCPNVRGAEAILWDWANGVIRTDLPGGAPPTIANIGGSFFHPNYPPLSFIYPTGWAPETVTSAQSVGVNLIRQDGRAVWRWFGASVNAGLSARQVRDFEIDQVLQFLQVGGNTETICVQESSRSPAPGVGLSFSTILIHAGGFTAAIAAQITSFDGLPSSTAGVQVAVGPTDEYGQLIFDVFLPIGFQMLYGQDRVPDSDGDGTPDSLDNFPFDSTKT